MLKNYLKIAWRNLRYNKTISVISIIGLSLGFAFALLIGGYIWKELQVNQSFRNINNQYLIQSTWKETNMGPDITTLAPLAAELKRNHPDLIANYYRWDGITSSVSKGDKHFREEIQVGDPTFLSMFGFKLARGDVRTAFTDPFSAVITTNAALKYFNSVDVIGQTIEIENFSGEKKDFIVSGVLDTYEDNSVSNLTTTGNTQIYLPLQALDYFRRAEIESWENFVIVTFIELKNGASAREIEKLSKELIRKHAGEFVSANLTPVLTPLKNYYLQANGGLVRKMILSLSIIVVFILAMAVVNFVNITIARSGGRMREIGVRKVLGGAKKQLILQFLTESVVIVGISSSCSLLIYQLCKPQFEEILGKSLLNLNKFPSVFVLWFAVITFLTGLISGIFPAFVLSSFNTIDSLKGKWQTVKENTFLKKTLVGFQFSVATFVLVGMFVISKQVALFFSDQLGYNKEYMISVTTPRNWNHQGVEQMKVTRDALAALPFISNASISYAIPNGRAGGSAQIRRPGQSFPVTAVGIETDSKYAETYEIPIVAGSFLKDNSDSTAIVMNQAAINALGWIDPEQAVGQQIAFSHGNELFTIIGVTKDFHFGSMKEAIKPLVFVNVNANPRYRFMSLRLKPGNIQENISALRQKWNEILGGAPFDYTFMDASLAQLYKTELQLKKSAYMSSALSIVIVLLGIIGLVSISIKKRTREIGIRKVLGSSVKGIVSLFLKEFLLILLLAGTLTCPLAYYVFRNWLNNYSIRIELGPQPFIISIVFLTLVTLLLICLLTLKTAISNPVKSLRTD